LIPALNPYVAPRWLPGGHLQTIYASLFKPPRVSMERVRWETPDGDFIDVDFAGDPGAGRLLVLFHGLEGSSDSHYARAISAAAAAAGWRIALPHFRGCSGELNRLPRAYHSGDSEEINWILLKFFSLNKNLFTAGISLGGNALLKWLGERGDAAAAVVRRAAAVSALARSHRRGTGARPGSNRLLYTRHFLTTLIPKSLAKLKRFPESSTASACGRQPVSASSTTW
jgi:predicted alpha/beta-fold hydrolase